MSRVLAIDGVTVHGCRVEGKPLVWHSLQLSVVEAPEDARRLRLQKELVVSDGAYERICAMLDQAKFLPLRW